MITLILHISVNTYPEIQDKDMKLENFCTTMFRIRSYTCMHNVSRLLHANIIREYNTK